MTFISRWLRQMYLQETSFQKKISALRNWYNQINKKVFNTKREGQTNTIKQQQMEQMTSIVGDPFSKTLLPKLTWISSKSVTLNFNHDQGYELFYIQIWANV